MWMAWHPGHRKEPGHQQPCIPNASRDGIWPNYLTFFVKTWETPSFGHGNTNLGFQGFGDDISSSEFCHFDQCASKLRQNKDRQSTDQHCHPLSARGHFRVVSWVNRAKSMRKADWLGDTTWYQLTNQLCATGKLESVHQLRVTSGHWSHDRDPEFYL